MVVIMFRQDPALARRMLGWVLVERVRHGNSALFI